MEARDGLIEWGEKETVRNERGSFTERGSESESTESLLGLRFGLELALPGALQAFPATETPASQARLAWGSLTVIWTPRKLVQLGVCRGFLQAEL